MVAVAVAVAAEAAVAGAVGEAAAAVVGVAVVHPGDVVAGAKHLATLTLARDGWDRPCN